MTDDLSDVARTTKSDRALDDVTTAMFAAAVALQEEGYCPEHAAEIVAVAIKKGLSLILLAAQEDP